MKTASLKRSSLDIQAEGLTVLNEYGRFLVGELVPYLKTFIDQKIVNQDGSKSKKFSAGLPNLDKEGYSEPGVKFISYNTWFTFTSSSVIVYAKVCIHGGRYEDNTYYCNYFEQALYIAELKENVLVSVDRTEKIFSSYKLDQSFTAEKLRADIEAYKAAKEQANKLLNAIPAHVIKSEYLSRY